jgi:hypothetical protein
MVSLVDKLEELSKKEDFIGIRQDEYSIGIFDSGFKLKFPFVLTNDIYSIVREICCEDKRKNVTNAYEWIVRNIKCGESKRGSKGYRNSVEVFHDREGVCGEMAALFITMVRCVGVRSSYVYVDEDLRGNRVNHACALVDLRGKYKSVTMVDLSYPMYDVNHKNVKYYTDFEIFQMFNTIGKNC